MKEQSYCNCMFQIKNIILQPFKNMGNCLTDALWAEFYKGIGIDDYLKMVDNNEHLCHHGEDVAIRKWLSSPYYEVERKVYKELVDAVSPLINNGVMDSWGLDVTFWEPEWGESVEVILNTNCDINGEDTLFFDGSYNTISKIVRDFVESLELEHPSH